MFDERVPVTVAVAVTLVASILGVGFEPSEVQAQTPTTASFSSATYTGSEASETGRFTVELSSAQADDITVRLSPAAGTATPTTAFFGTKDYVGLPGSVLVPAGSTSAHIDVMILDDDINDDDETIELVIQSGTGYQPGSIPRAVMTITDNDDPMMVITEGGGSTVVSESDDDDTYKVVLNGKPAADVTVTITSDAAAVVDGPDAGDTGTATETLTFTPSTWDDAQTVTVSGVDDNTINAGGARTATLTHATTSTDAAYNGLSASVSVRVVDTDPVPTLAISPATMAKSSFDNGNTVTMTLTPEHVSFLAIGRRQSAPGSIDSDGGGEGVAGHYHRDGKIFTDEGLALFKFTNAPVGLTVDSGTLGKKMANVHGQAQHRAATVILSYDGGDLLANQTVTLAVDEELLRRSLDQHHAVRYPSDLSATFTIEASDDPPDVEFLASESIGYEGHTALVTVEASKAMGLDYTVSYMIAGTATAGTDYKALSGSLTIPGGATSANIKIPITSGDPDTTIVLSLTDDADYNLGTQTRHTVTTSDDELPTLVLSKPRLHLTEGGPVQAYSIALTRNPKANVDVTVTSPDKKLLTVHTTGGRAADSVTLRFTRRDWATPQIVTVRAVQDADEHSEQEMLITHTIGGTQPDSYNFSKSPYFSHEDDDGNNVGVSLPSLPVYVTDDDPEPDEGLTLHYDDADPDLPIVIEEGKATTLELEWSRALTATETAVARLRVTGAVYGEDYTIKTSTAGVTVAPSDDGSDEILVTWKESTAGTAELKIKSVNDDKRATGELYLVVTLISVYSPDDSIIPPEEDDDHDHHGHGMGEEKKNMEDHPPPEGVRLHSGPQTERIHVLSEDRLIVKESRRNVADRVVFKGLETAKNVNEVTTNRARTELAESASGTSHKFELRLSADPDQDDVMVTVTSSNEDKLKIAPGSSPAAGSQTFTFTSSNWGDAKPVGLIPQQDDDSDDETVFVFITISGSPAYSDNTEVRSFRVEISDDDAGVRVVPGSLTVTEEQRRGVDIPGADPPRRSDQIAMRLQTDPGDGMQVVIAPIVEFDGGEDASDKVSITPKRLRFDGGSSGDWNEWKTFAVGGQTDSDADDEEIIITWTVSNYGTVTTPESVRVTVLDSDPAVRISPTNVDLVEGAGGLNYTVVLNAPPSHRNGVVIVTPTIGDMEAVSLCRDSDENGVACRPRPLRFDARNWDQPKTVAVYPVNDMDQADETVTITHAVTTSGRTGYDSVSAPGVTVHVRDDEGPGGIVVEPHHTVEEATGDDHDHGEDGDDHDHDDHDHDDERLVIVEDSGVGSFSVSLLHRPSVAGDVVVRVSGATGSLVVDTDGYVVGAQDTLTFTQADWYIAQTVLLTYADDGDTDDVEHVLTVEVDSKPAGLPAIDPTDLLVYVQDDEFSGPIIGIHNSAVTPVVEGANLFVPFNLTSAPSSLVTVTVHISETGDYVAAGEEGDHTVQFCQRLQFRSDGGCDVGMDGQLVQGSEAAYFVPIVDDDFSEPDGTVSATLKLGSGYRITGDVTRTRAVSDDGDTGTGATPELSFDQATDSIAESGGTLSVTVNAAPAPSSALTVNLTSADGSATGGGTDYTAPATVTFPASATSHTFTVAINNDSVDEPDETFTLTLASGSGYTVDPAKATTTVTITDDDDPTASFTQATYTGSEATGTGSFMVTLSREQASAVTVSYSVGGSATSGTDYTALSGSVSIAAGSTTASIAVAVTDDMIDDDDEIIILTLTTGTGYRIPSPATATMTITDDDATVVSLVRTDSGSIAESGTGTKADAEFTVTLGRQLVAGEVAEVPLVLSGTNVAAGDVSVAKKSGGSLNRGVTVGSVGTLTPTVTFTGHGTNVVQTATLLLTAVPDSTTETAETVTVSLGPDGTGTNGFDVTTRATNVDGGADPHSSNNSFNVGIDADPVTPPPPLSGLAVSFERGAYNVAERDGTVSVTVNAKPAPTADLVVSFTLRGTADCESDYAFGTKDCVAETGTVTIKGGQESATVSLTLVQDGNDSERAETVVLALTDGADYDLGSVQKATVTIAGADGMLLLELSQSETASLSLSISEGRHDPHSGLEPGFRREAAYSVSLSSKPSDVVWVDITVPAGVEVSAAGGLFFDSDDAMQPRLFFLPSDWNEPQRVAVRVVEDDDTKTIASATLTHTASGGGYVSVTGEVTLTVDDTAWPESWTDFLSLLHYRGGRVLSEGGHGAHFAVTRSRTYTGDPDAFDADAWVPIPDAWGFQVCFEGTAALGRDYLVRNRFNLPLPMDPNQSNCSLRNNAAAGTGLAAGQDRAHFYIRIIDDAHEDSGETIRVVVKDPIGTSRHRSGMHTFTYTITNHDDPGDGEDPQPDTGTDSTDPDTDDPDTATDPDSDTTDPDDGEDPQPDADIDGTVPDDGDDPQPDPPAGPTAEQIAACVTNELLETVRGYYKANRDKPPNYGENWKRVLIAFGDVQDPELLAYTADEALKSEAIWAGWKPVREALQCLER